MKINRHQKFHHKMRAEGGRMILFRISPELTAGIDALVASELFRSRSAVARHAVEKLLAETKSNPQKKADAANVG